MTQSSRPKLRPYVASDRDACLRVFESNIPRFFREHERPEFEQFLDAGSTPYFVLTVDGEIVGCGGYAIAQAEPRADLCWGMVAQKRHGSRLGEYLLLGRMAEIVRAPTVQSIRLGTCQLTSGFFEKYGFVVQSQQGDAIAPGLDEVEMRLELSDSARAAIRQRWEAR